MAGRVMTAAYGAMVVRRFRYAKFMHSFPVTVRIQRPRHHRRCCSPRSLDGRHRRILPFVDLESL